MAGVLTGTISQSKYGSDNILYSSDALDATSLSSKATTGIGGCMRVTVQAVADANLTGTVAFKLQASNNGTNFDDISGATGSIASASGSASIHLDSPPGLFIRFQVTGAGGAGTVTPTFALKGI